MRIEAILIGGPRDGERHALPARWPDVRFAVQPRINPLEERDPSEMVPFPKQAIYRCDAHDGPGTATDYVYVGTF